MAIEKIIDIQIQSNSEQAVGSLRSQLRQAQADVSELSDKFGATSREAIEAAKRAGELKDRIGDAKALTDAFNPDAKFKALSSSLAGVAGGFAAVQGGMALFGKQSEDVEKTLLKVQSAMALSQGLQSVGESIDSFKQLGAVLKSTSAVQKVMTATTAAYTFVNQAATTGLKLFRLALIGTGIGAVVVGLGLLIANFDKVKETIMKVIPGLSSVSKVIGGIVNSITDFVGATSDASRALDKLKENADKTLSVNKKFMQEHGDQVDQYTKKRIDAKNAYAEAIKEDGANQVALAKRLNRELIAIEISRGEEKQKAQKEANEKAAEAKRKSDEKQAKLDEEQRKIDEENIKANFLKTIPELDEEIVIAELTAIDAKNQAKREKDENYKQETLDAQSQFELQNAQIIYDSEEARAERESELNEQKLQSKKDYYDAASGLVQDGQAFMDKIEAAGIGRSRATIAIQKSLALVQIGIDTAKAFSTAVPMAIKAGEEAAKLAGPAAPIVGPLAVGVSYATSALTIIGNINKAKKILGAGGGGASAPSISDSASASGGGSTPPRFNVVGASGTNQLAQSIGAQQQQPIQAYVVANNVTTAQSLQRNIIESATIG